MTAQPTSIHKRQFGQSLVEVALFLPILVILIAGVVEVSQLVITQNRVSNAARVAARYGANGGEDEGILNTGLNSITQTLVITDTDWDIWVIRGTINDSSDGFSDWEFSHVYGISNTVLFSDVNETSIQDEVLDELKTGNPNVAGLRIVGSYMLHDVDSILGLDAFPPLAKASSVRALNVMRVTGVDLDTTAGCDAFPIAVNEEIRSVTPPGTGANPYPEANEFTYPNTPPTYNQFTNHVSDIPLTDAQEGYIYKIRQGAPGTGNFSWLVWNILYVSANANTLADSLTWPGDSSNYPTYGYYEPGDPNDTTLNIDDWVASSTGAISANAVQTQMEEHVSRERTLRLIVWDTTNGGTGVNLWYQVKRFAIFRFHGYRSNAGQGGPWILAEFIRWDDSCGQLAP